MARTRKAARARDVILFISYLKRQKMYKIPIDHIPRKDASD
jgi:hypothetical protein